MSSKFNMKKNVMAVVLSLMMVSSAVVFAAEDYSFTIALYAEDAYSTAYKKEIVTDWAYVLQTGSSPGAYSVTYTVCKNDAAKTAMTNEKTYSSTDYTTNQILYKGNYDNTTNEWTVLKGHYNGTDYCTVMGRWNPNG